MSNTVKIFIVIVAVVVVAILIILSANVGGIAIRNNVTAIDTFSLSASEPVMRGVPVVLRWEMSDLTSDQRSVDILVRDKEEVAIGQAAVDAGSAIVSMPCDLTNNTVAIIIRDSSSRAIVATKSVSLLPPGPECVQ